MRRARHRFFPAVVAVLAGAFLYWTARQSGPLLADAGTGSFLGDYSASLAAGRTYLSQAPDPRLAALADPWDPAQRLKAGIGALIDASYYRGRYYLYFGIVPFALLLVPYYRATGHLLGAHAAVFVFALAGVWSQLALLRFLAARRYPGLGRFSFFLIAAAIMTGNQILPHFWSPDIHDVEIVAGYAFLSAAVAAASFSWASPRHRCGWLALASGLGGLASGCRPDCLFGSCAVAAAALALGWPACDAGDRRRLALSACLPLAGVLGLLLAFNAVRFGNPLEFGFRYQILDPGTNHHAQAFWTMRFEPFNLREYLGARPRLGRFFPFILDAAGFQGGFPRGYKGVDMVHGWLWTMPVLWLLPLALLFLREAFAPARAAAVIALAAGLANLATLCGLDSAQFRYAADAAPSLELAAVVVAMDCLDRSRSRGRAGWLARGAINLVVGWTALMSLGSAFAIYRIYHDPDSNAPSDAYFDQTALLFNRPTFLFDRLLRIEAEVPRVVLRLPADSWGKEEPLLVTGDVPLQNFVYLYYAYPGHLQVGVEVMGLGGPVSRPFPIDYRRPHVVEVLLGSSLPPPGDPLYDGLTAAEVARLRSRVAIWVDGQRVVDAVKATHPTCDRWYWGESPDDPAFGSRFTGALLQIERTPAKALVRVGAGAW